MKDEAAVTVETQDVPLEQSTMAEFKAAREKGEEVATRETVKVEEKQAESEKPKVKGGFQARIDRLIKQQATTEERAAAAEKKAAELEAKINGNGHAAPKDGDEPKRESFQTDAEYNRAVVRWEVKQEMKAEAEAAQRQAFNEQVKEARNRYNTRMIALQAENEEYKELMQQDILVPDSIEWPITMEMENGADVTIFLAQNPEVCAELSRMSPSRAIAEAWRISEKLEAAGDESNKDEKEEEVKIEEEKPAHRAPAPIRPVSSGTSRSTISLDKTDFAAYKKLRAQGRVQ